jgi:hypothetical protein
MDYLQVDNITGILPADFNLTLFGGGEQVYSGEYALDEGLSRIVIDLKSLSDEAETGVITYENEDLVFRITFENESGAVAEFKTADIGGTVDLYFSDCTSLVQFKGFALANMATEPVTIDIMAIGNNEILSYKTIQIGSRGRIVGNYTDWFPDVDFEEIESVRAVALTDFPALSGFVMSSDNDGARLLFIPGVVTEDAFLDE